MKQIKAVVFDDKNEIEFSNMETITINSIESLKNLLQDDISLVIINNELKNQDAINIIHEIKDDGFQVPIIVLASNENENDLLKSFDAGCDDYISKTTNKSIVYARIYSILKRYQQISDDIVIGKLHYYANAKQFYFDGKELDLSQKEKALLLEFMKNKNQILEREYLVKTVWDGIKVQQKTLNVLIQRLKQKLKTKDTKDVISSIYGKGYMFSM